MSQFFQITGRRHAVSGKKAKPFSSTFGGLGVDYGLGTLHRWAFYLGNKQDRLSRIGRLVSQVSEAGWVSPKNAASIHGLLSFASGFALGKALQTTAHGFSMLASGVAL